MHNNPSRLSGFLYYGPILPRRADSADKNKWRFTSAPASPPCEFDVSKLFWFVGTSSVAFEVIVKIELEPHHQPARVPRSFMPKNVQSRIVRA